jgi:methylmalonyl-CoA/ethylmalonyl-CoA epimerase
MSEGAGEGLAGRFGLPPIDQVGYVVADIEQAAARMEPIFGPFKIVDSPVEGALFRGVKADAHLKLAFARSGPIEIELIQPVSGRSPHAEHLARHGEGAHHVRFPVRDLDGKLAEMNAAGFETLWYKRYEGAGNIVFAYVEAPAHEGGGVFELLEMG